MLLVAVVDQGVEVVDGLHPDIAALATIAAIGTAHFNELFPPERHRPRTAVTGLHIDFCFIEEFHGGLLTQGGETGNC